MCGYVCVCVCHVGYTMVYVLCTILNDVHIVQCIECYKMYNSFKVHEYIIQCTLYIVHYCWDIHLRVQLLGMYILHVQTSD